jgi:hypothetical protein
VKQWINPEYPPKCKDMAVVARLFGSDSKIWASGWGCDPFNSMLASLSLKALKKLASKQNIVPTGDKRLKQTWIAALEPKAPPETGEMSRKQYAKVLKDAGLDLTGQDVFHIIANSHGGADHPDNYLYALGSTFNRTIGDKHDAFNCFLAGKEKTEKAVRVSMKYGNAKDPRGKEIKKYKCRGPSSDPEDEAGYLFNKGQAMCKAMTAWVRESEKQ